jgi:hypothetical protein
MSTPRSHAPQRAPRDLGALAVQALARLEGSLDGLAAHRREDEARTAAPAAAAAPASTEPEDEGLALLRRLREAGL